MFQATTNELKVELKTGGDEGTMRRPRLALWDAGGGLISCQQYYSDWGDIIMGAVNLIPGDWYYIAVDNDNNNAYRGTFTLCVDDEADYDFHEGAEVIPHFPNWCSAEAMASCWLGTIYGNLRRGQMAVWEEDGTEVKCIGRVVDQGTTTLSTTGLSIGDWYYVSVDDDYRSGTFSFCIDNTVDYDYWDGAEILSHAAGIMGQYLCSFFIVICWLIINT